MDFANKYLGGGVLGHGCVQEEIRFVICPELMVSMLFTEVLRPNEALMIIGCERYSKYSGYGGSFQWAGDYRDVTAVDSSCRRRVAVLAVDALPYGNATHQYRPPAVSRELNKAWVGFTFYSEDQPTSTQYPGIATGNWGCGAFGGSPQLKTLIQLMACAEARRPMAYYTFDDQGIRDEFVNMYNLLSRYNVTVGQLYQLIARFCQTDVRKHSLHRFIEHALKNGEIPPACPPREAGGSAPASGHEEPTDSATKKQKTEESDKMDISDTLDVSEIELSESLQRELLNQSPDLFPESDSQETQIENYTQNEASKSHTSKNNHEDKMATSSKPSLTADLFDEMNKFDQSNGKLNLSKSHPSILDDSAQTNDDVGTENTERAGTDPTSDMKKKMAKKITDYFSKKAI